MQSRITAGTSVLLDAAYQRPDERFYNRDAICHIDATMEPILPVKTEGPVTKSK